MYSLNAPVPEAVADLATDLASAFDLFRERERHTLLVKRLTVDDRRPPEARSIASLADRAREAIAGAPACEARIGSVECFERAARGPGSVVYLAVESPGLHDLHRRLAREFPPVPDIEGEGYVPHVTVGRVDPDRAPGSPGASVPSFEPVTWTVDRLRLWDATHEEAVETFSLPG